MEKNGVIPNSELIVNPDGSIFHLQLHPGQLSETILIVGDAARVYVIQEYLEAIEHTTVNREYVSTTGKYKGKRISVVSTGVGLGNVDIVMNELDALFNVDFTTRQIKPELTQLQIIRIGTSGGLQASIPINSFVVSEFAVALDNLLPFYQGSGQVVDAELSLALKKAIAESHDFLMPKAIKASSALFSMLTSEETHSGITITAPGFYGPQGREIRLQPAINAVNETLEEFRI